MYDANPKNDPRSAGQGQCPHHPRLMRSVLQSKDKSRLSDIAYYQFGYLSINLISEFC